MPMQTTQTNDIASPDVKDAEQAHQRDLILPSLFISAAALILAYQDPVNYAFKSWPELTLAVAILGVALVAFATWRRIMPLLFAGVGILLVTIAFGVVTQPTQLSVPVVAIWPLRVALVFLVGFSWAFLMQPAGWLRRA